MAVAAVAGGHHAVEKVHPPEDGLKDIPRCAHAHQITGLVLWHMLLHRFDGVIHLLVALPHCQATDGIAGKVQLGDLLHVGHANIMEHRPLVDAEKHLPRVHRVLPAVVVGQSRLAALQPADGTVTGFLHIVSG